MVIYGASITCEWKVKLTRIACESCAASALFQPQPDGTVTERLLPAEASNMVEEFEAKQSLKHATKLKSKNPVSPEITCPSIRKVDEVTVCFCRSVTQQMVKYGGLVLKFTF